jgi:hypothetical protein
VQETRQGAKAEEEFAMKVKVSWLVLTASLAVVAACSSQKEEAPAQEQPTLHEVMKNEIDLHADELWEISNPALGDNAHLDPARMNDELWGKIEQRAAALQQAALDLAKLDPIVVVKPGVKIADEGVPYGDTGEEVQANVDKDPQKLRDFANALAVHAGDIASAAKRRDTERAGLLIGELDGVCEDCHLEYWYPSQKALLEQYGIER